MKRVLLATTALGAVVVLLTAFTLPPARQQLTGSSDAVLGAVHVHTNRSDGRASPDDVARAAARAGLRFVIFTDHGDGTRVPDPPVYRLGVLCLDGVEISTEGGHYIAFDMPAAPYPLGGAAAAVVEDVQRLGGFGIAAHPDSPKEELHWANWALPYDGIELLNLDTSWRLRFQRPGLLSKVELMLGLFGYPLRPAETIGRALSIDPQTASVFARLSETRPIVIIGGVDVHGRLGLRNPDPAAGDYSLPFPGYESVFRTLAVQVQTSAPMTGDASRDAALVTEAIRSGKLHTVNTSLASPAVFEFSARNEQGVATEGTTLVRGGAVTLHARSNAPAGFSTVIFQGSEAIATADGPELTAVAHGDSGIFRAEIRATDRAQEPVWIVSNPIYVREAATPPVEAPIPAPTLTRDLLDASSRERWRVEVAPASRATMTAAGGSPLTLEYELGQNPRGQFAAIVVETRGGVAEYRRLRLTLRADRPMRVSVQARVAVTPSADDSWGRSIYVDAAEREVVVALDELAPRGSTRTARPPLDDIHSLLLSVDEVNSAPGSRGQLWILGAALEN